MNSLLKDLSSWSATAREIEFNAEIKAKMGPHGDEGALNSKHVQAVVFRYTSHGHLIAGYVVAPRRIDHPLPVIIYNRGGTKDFGLVRPGMLFTHIATLAQWGYIVIGSQYPGNSLSVGHDEWGDYVRRCWPHWHVWRKPGRHDDVPVPGAS